ncbi:MAG TPA: NAD(+)/NADH kinase [Candidatus Woesebacteria bacterium]|nr:NAD(+)/NADH kinase [Candidatus Woesebacteria bacterium]
MAITLFNPQNRPIEKSFQDSIEKWTNQLDLVVTVGGDGTILGAANNFDQPILPLRSSSHCLRCSPITNLDVIFEQIVNHQIEPTSFSKLFTTINNQQIDVLNEFNIHTQNPQSALRFIYRFNQQAYSEEIIGDGLVIATPFGSTGYFKSITQTVFYQGIGIAFNNPTKPHTNQIINDNSIIEIKITRGPAILCGDNHFQEIIDQPTIHIAKSTKTANIYLL